jgi:CDP-4-dehydro-6-deoxyglucose reductase, E1
MDNYPLSSSTWNNDEVQAIESLIKQNSFTMGDKVREFESNFSRFLGSKYCVMVNSGSSANLLATAALFYMQNPMLESGDEVIVPAVSWPTTYFPLHQYGLKLKFVDIDLKTLNYDLNALSSAISDKTKMIMVVNLLGNPNDFDKISKLIDGRDIFLLEDNCESLGSTFKGKKTGTFGIMGTFSSFFSHHISTMEGGLVSTDNEELYHILLSLRAHGWTRNLPDKNHISNKSKDSFEESFRFVLPGYNVRPLEMSGAIGIEQLKKLPSFLMHRNENAIFFQDLFCDHKDFYIQKTIGTSSWFGFSFIIKPSSKLKREDVIKILIKNNVECRPIVSGNFVRNEVMKFLNFSIHKKLKNADYLHDNGFFVGNHQFNIKDKISMLYKSLSNL